MYKKRFLSMMLAAAFGLSLTVAANAAPLGGAGAGVEPGEYASNSDTVIGIAETKVDTGNLSVEIPLYVTMVVVDDGTDPAKVLVPGNYYIKNSATQEDGITPSGNVYIGVSGLSFEKLKDSTYNTIAEGAVNSAQVGEIYLELGEVPMPAMSSAGIQDVDLTTAGNVFYDDLTSKINTVAGGQDIDVGIVAKINAEATYNTQGANATENSTVAQFKIKYTVSAFNKDGQRIAAAYVGDDSVQAGLGKWDANTGTWDTSVFAAQGTDHDPTN